MHVAFKLGDIAYQTILLPTLKAHEEDLDWFVGHVNDILGVLVYISGVVLNTAWEPFRFIGRKATVIWRAIKPAPASSAPGTTNTDAGHNDTSHANAHTPKQTRTSTRRSKPRYSTIATPHVPGHLTTVSISSTAYPPIQPRLHPSERSYDDIPAFQEAMERAQAAFYEPEITVGVEKGVGLESRRRRGGPAENSIREGDTTLRPTSLTNQKQDTTFTIDTTFAIHPPTATSTRSLRRRKADTILTKESAAAAAATMADENGEGDVVNASISPKRVKRATAGSAAVQQILLGPSKPSAKALGKRRAVESHDDDDDNDDEDARPVIDVERTSEKLEQRSTTRSRTRATRATVSPQGEGDRSGGVPSGRPMSRQGNTNNSLASRLPKRLGRESATISSAAGPATRSHSTTNSTSEVATVTRDRQVAREAAIANRRLEKERQAIRDLQESEKRRPGDSDISNRKPVVSMNSATIAGAAGRKKRGG